MPSERGRSHLLRRRSLSEWTVLVWNIVERHCVCRCLPWCRWSVLRPWGLRRDHWNLSLQHLVRRIGLFRLRGRLQWIVLRQAMPARFQQCRVRGSRCMHRWCVHLRNKLVRHHVRHAKHTQRLSGDLSTQLLRNGLLSSMPRRRKRVQRSRPMQRWDQWERVLPVRRRVRREWL